MSKSDNLGKGVIFLGNDPEIAAKKIMSAETDSIGTIPSSLDYEQQPGISNLLQMVALLDNQPVQDVVREWAGKKSYGDLKKAVAEKVSIFLADYQDRLSKVDELALQTRLEASETAMNETANETLLKVQQAVGLRPLK
jgi:tryptophanyl-tRNA synthetase